MSDLFKDSIDWLATAAAAAVILKLIPAIAGLLAIAWHVLRFYEYYKGKKNGNERINRLDS
jgi:hypothetical protein